MRANPPAPAIVGDVVRFTVVSVSQFQTCYTTHEYMSTAIGNITFALLQSEVALFSAAVAAAYAACLPALSTIIGIIGEVVSASTVAKFMEVDDTAGTVVAANLPLEIAAVVNKVSSLKGGHGVGHFQMPAVPVTFTTPATDPNRVNVAGLAAYTALCLALQITFPGVSAPHVDPVVATRPIPPAKVVSLAQKLNAQQPNPLLGTARRRKEGRGI